MALPAPNTADIDNLLARYRAARSQQALFDVRGDRAGTGYDEPPARGADVLLGAAVSAWINCGPSSGALSTTTASPTSRSTGTGMP